MNRKKAAQLLREGKRAEAREALQRCIDITPQMALDLMNVSQLPILGFYDTVWQKETVQIGI